MSRKRGCFLRNSLKCPHQRHVVVTGQSHDDLIEQMCVLNRIYKSVSGLKEMLLVN